MPKRYTEGPCMSLIILHLLRTGRLARQSRATNPSPVPHTPLLPPYTTCMQGAKLLSPRDMYVDSQQAEACARVSRKKSPLSLCVLCCLLPMETPPSWVLSSASWATFLPVGPKTAAHSPQILVSRSTKLFPLLEGLWKPLMLPIILYESPFTKPTTQYCQTFLLWVLVPLCCILCYTTVQSPA